MVREIDSTGRFTAVLAAGVCALLTLIIWRSVSAQQDMWPFPALYLVEMVVLSVTAAWAAFGGNPARRFVVWIAAGAMTGFAILGAWSIGFFYAPFALAFALLALRSEVRSQAFRLQHLLAFAAGGLAQAATMLAVVRLLWGGS